LNGGVCTIISFVSSVNPIYPAYCPETAIEEFVMPVVETDEATYSREKGVS
jgi:hypothetical protein